VKILLDFDAREMHVIPRATHKQENNKLIVLNKKLIALQ
jgi:hypothetical protein